MSIAPLVIVPTLGAAYAYWCMHYARRNATDEERAQVKKQAIWTAIAAFVALLVAGIFIMP